MDPIQSQLLLINSERFGLVLAENMNEVGSPAKIKSDNICKGRTYLKVSDWHWTVLVIVAELVNATSTEYIVFNGTNKQNSVLISTDFIKERSYTTGNIYRNYWM